MRSLLILALFVLPASLVFAQTAPLDPAYPHRPGVNTNWDSTKNLGTRSNIEDMISIQSEVKSQGSRGTCSIFSAISLLESLLIKNSLASADLDLSEEWLSYVSQSYRKSDVEGSWSAYNWFLTKAYGAVSEQTLPYNTSLLNNAESGKGLERCGHLIKDSKQQKICLVAQYDPSLLNNPAQMSRSVLSQAAEEALELKTSLLSLILTQTTGPWSQQYRVSNLTTIRSLLDENIPLTLELDVHYGAWNHPLADSYGIGLDRDEWRKGIVSYAEPQSVDRLESNKNRAGHSIVVVGYDDSKIVQKTMKMKDGSTQTFSYRGVYYFKNSWGTTSFGSEFEIDGINYPGYGMITYKYAHELGSFFQLPSIK
jgi:hypothetical protein